MRSRNVSELWGIPFTDHQDGGLVILENLQGNTTPRPNSNSQSCSAGKPSWHSECARETTWDSVVDREVDVCLFPTQAKGKNVLGPYKI